MKPGWYILNFHSVDWEDSILTRAIGGTTRPDVFRHQLERMASVGRFVSVPEGQARLESGDAIDEVLFSVWFDDGFAGLVDFALPICQSFGVLPALSVCSRFALREEMFWRAKLSYLAYADGMRFVRAKLRRSFKGVPYKIRSWTLEHFDEQVLAIVDEIYREHTSEAFRDDAFRIFADADGLQALADAGWLITNHSAAHWPLAPGLGWDVVEREFDQCEAFVRRWSPDNRHWVIPFAFGAENYLDALMRRATVVEVGERRNTVETWQRTGRLFRFDAPMRRNVLAALG
ncbi:MAG TPA: hypothetical protein ENK57_06410 [Polyangiaceae bacterium]|nr:hypothetical protein [Polyangiaceae bacterium]